MTDLGIEFCGVKSPNPFWLASGPPTNSEYQVLRAFDAGWGGAVWKTICSEPAVNLASRYGAIDYDGRKVAGLTNIELYSDRALDVNLKEIARVKKSCPRQALFVSVMAETNREAWHDITKRTQDAGADGLELNLSCPHGMDQSGMGSAVGQVPDWVRRVTQWVKEVAIIPVMVKLTPNVTDVTTIGRAAVSAGADALSLINALNSIIGVNLDTLAPEPAVRGQSSHGGYCGPAVKPIALHMVSAVASDPEIRVPVSGMGGIQAWPDAVEFLLLGAGSVQICTAVMHYGFRIVEHLASGLTGWMLEKGFQKISDFSGLSLARIKSFGELDLNYEIVAEIAQDRCIHCGLCYIACEDGAHQSIRWDRVSIGEFVKRDDNRNRVVHSGGNDVLAGAGADEINVFTIKQDSCVGCNLCSLVCPVEGCINMKEVDTGRPPLSWNEYQELLAAGRIENRPPRVHV